MKRIADTTFVWAFIIFIVSSMACDAETTIAPFPTPSLFDQIIAHAPSLSPSLLWNQPAIVSKLSLTPTEYRMEKEYTLNKESVTPPPGAAFLWVSVRIDNNMSDNAETPLFIFELYYQGEATDKTTFGVDRPEKYPGFTPDKIYPGQSREGWILFEVPERIDISKAYLTIRSIISATDYVAWRISSD